MWVGKKGLFLYQGEIMVDLDVRRGMIAEFGKNDDFGVFSSFLRLFVV